MSDYTGGEGGYTPLMGASNTPYDISNTTRHEVPNYEGTPTQFYDDSGLKAILTRKGIMDVNSFNPIVKEGEKITANTPRQATNGDGQLLFLDSNGEQTTRPTSTPMVGGTIGDAAYMKAPVHGGGVFGDIGYDLRSTAKDPLFHKFLLTAAAIGSGGLAAGALGAGAVGAAGAGELGAGVLGTIGGDIGAFTAADAAASVAGQGAFDLAGGLGMTLDQAVNTGLISASGELTAAGTEALMGLGGEATGAAGFSGLSGGLTDAEASALMGQYEQGALGGYGAQAGTGLTLADALKYAKMGLSGAGLLGGLLGGGSGGGSPGAGGGSGAGNNPLNGLGNGVGGGSGGGSGSSSMAMGNLTPQLISTGSAPTTNISGLIDYKPLTYIDPSHYSNVSDIKPSSVFEGGLHAAHGGYIKESMGRHPELQDIDPRLLSMIMQSMSFQDGDKRHVPEFITGATGHYVKGKGDGQSDDIPAMLADGEFVWDADTVAQLGNGSSDAGAKFLDKFREAVRSHKRSAPNDKIPPKALPLQYVKEAMKNTEKE